MEPLGGLEAGDRARPRRRPRRSRSIASRCGRTVAGSRSGARAARRRLVERRPRARGIAAAGRAGSTPTFSPSPRSTRGTTRMIAYWKTSRGGVGHARPPRRTVAAPSSRAPGSGRRRAAARRRRRPPGRPAATCPGAPATSSSTGPASIRRSQTRRRPRRRPGERQQDVVGECARTRRRAWASGSRHVWWTYSAAPWSISHVPAVPDEQVRVLHRPVRVRDQAVEPDDVRGACPGRSRRPRSRRPG